MAAIAVGDELGHFAAPDGPLCLEFRGLPYPPDILIKKGYKIVHSVDKGPNTSRLDDTGMTARAYFKNIRERE
jgi:hypothetical protein